MPEPVDADPDGLVRTGEILGPFSLEDMALVDAPPPPAFDALTRLAGRLFKTPVSLISMVEETRDRQYFTSQQGLPEPWASARQTPLSHSFCQHVKRRKAPLVVEDATKHALVRDNPSIRDLNVIAYLGAPIFGPVGEPLGALCVIDGQARNWTEEDVSTLTDVARCVSDEIMLRATTIRTINLHRELRTAHERTQRYNNLRESVAHAFMTPDLPIQDRFTGLLQAGCRALGVDSGAIVKVDFDRSRVLFCHSEEERATPEAPPPRRRWLGARVLAGQANICLDDRADPLAGPARDLHGRQPSSYIGSPLVLDGVPYGVLEFSAAAHRPAPWSSEELSMMSVMSMFTCANLGLFGKLTSLQKSEAALLNYLAETRNGSPGAIV